MFLDARLERSLTNAALREGRTDMAKSLMEGATDTGKHVGTLQGLAAKGNLSGVMQYFESLKTSGVELTAVLYNTVLDACVECKALGEAERWMALMKEEGLV